MSADNPFENFDRILEHRMRLQIMAVLAANDAYDFNSLKELLNTTDGNLASHIKALEKEKYLEVHKTFVDRKPNTRYRISSQGLNAFKKHLDAMALIVKTQNI